MKTVFSGLKPTGEMTIGNYLGAIKHWPKTQESAERTIFFIPNLHALNARTEPELLRSRTFDLVAWLLTAGIDPSKSIILVQSMVSAHSELSWILNNYVTMGELGRMTQFKDKSKKQGREGQLVGLFDYPVLMAADILLYDSDEVPVGEDQAQHVELARDIADRFNKLYGPTFKLPKAVMPKFGARIKRLDDPKRKMSKSEHPDSYIALGESAESIVSKFKKAVTDSDTAVKYDPQAKPAVSNLIEIYAGFSEESIQEVENRFKGSGYGDFKSSLGELVAAKLTSLQQTYEKHRSDEKALSKLIQEGKLKAEAIADQKLKEVKQKIGLL